MVRVLKVGGAQHVEHVVDDGGAGVIGDRTGVWWWRGATGLVFGLVRKVALVNSK